MLKVDLKSGKCKYFLRYSPDMRQYYEHSSTFCRPIQRNQFWTCPYYIYYIIGNSRSYCKSIYPFIKICILTQIKSSCGSSIDTPDQKSQLVTLITNCRISKLRMLCRAYLSETKYTHNFKSPPSIGLRTDRVSLTTTNSWNLFKGGSVYYKMSRLSIYLKQHSIEMKHLFYSDISTHFFTKISILKMISSIFIYSFSQSSEIVYV